MSYPGELVPTVTENGIDTLLALLEAEEDWAGYITLLDEYAQLLQSDVEQATYPETA